MADYFYAWLDEFVPCKGESRSAMQPAAYRVMYTNYLTRKGRTLADEGLTAESAEKLIAFAMEQPREEADSGTPLFRKAAT